MIPWLRRFWRRLGTGHTFAPMPVIVGSPRSGTTLLRFMLDAHPDMAIPPETGFLPGVANLTDAGDALRDAFFRLVTTTPAEAPAWADFGIDADAFHRELMRIQPFGPADGVRAFYRMYADRFGKPRYGEKTPLYGRHLAVIEKLLPEAHFIHIIRDGRDVAVSLRRHWFSPGRDIATQARYWRDNVAAARQQGAVCRHYREILYEDLLRDTERTLRPLCEFLKLPFTPSMLDYHLRTPQRLREHKARLRIDGSVVVDQETRLRQQEMTTKPPDTDRIGAWKTAFTGAECAEFGAIAGSLLSELGYSDH
jgi:hypothetical protein